MTVPGLVPGLRLPPPRMFTEPAIEPVPERVAPLFTVTAVFPSEPFTRRLPKATVVVPV